jgi:hypothetical protein
MHVATRKFKSTLLLVAQLVFPGLALAQIQGSVVDVNNQPLANANVLLLNQKDSSLVSGIMASDEGTYNISNFKPGNYLIGVSLLGYKPAFSAPLR